MRRMVSSVYTLGKTLKLNQVNMGRSQEEGQAWAKHLSHDHVRSSKVVHRTDLVAERNLNPQPAPAGWKPKKKRFRKRKPSRSGNNLNFKSVYEARDFYKKNPTEDILWLKENWVKTGLQNADDTFVEVLNGVYFHLVNTKLKYAIRLVSWSNDNNKRSMNMHKVKKRTKPLENKGFLIQHVWGQNNTSLKDAASAIDWYLTHA